MRPQVVRRIGSFDDPNQILTRVGQVLIGPEEQIFVSQPQDQTILVFDLFGTEPTSIGREGEGPGEFEGLHTIGFLNDSLWAFDYSVPRFSFFSLTGELLGTRPWGTEMFRIDEVVFVPRAPVSVVLLPEEEALIVPGMMIRGQPPESGIRSEVMRIPFLRVGADLQIQDTIAWTIMEGTTVAESRGGEVLMFSVPFNDAPLHTLGPNGGGVAVVDRRRASSDVHPVFGISVVGPMGDTTFALSIPYDPIPITEDALKGIVSKVRSSPPRDRGGLSEEEIKDALAEHGLVPEYQVPVTKLVGTGDGMIWVRREEFGQDSVVWNVFDSNGTPTATVLLPADQEIKAGNGDLLVTLEHDEFDVPYLVVLRLELD